MTRQSGPFHGEQASEAEVIESLLGHEALAEHKRTGAGYRTLLRKTTLRECREMVQELCAGDPKNKGPAQLSSKKIRKRLEIAGMILDDLGETESSIDRSARACYYPKARGYLKELRENTTLKHEEKRVLIGKLGAISGELGWRNHPEVIGSSKEEQQAFTLIYRTIHWPDGSVTHPDGTTTPPAGTPNV